MSDLKRSGQTSFDVSRSLDPPLISLPPPSTVDSWVVHTAGPGAPGAYVGHLGDDSSNPGARVTFQWESGHKC